MFDIRGSGQSFAVFQVDTRVSRFYYSKERAEAAGDRLAKKKRQTSRPCISCTDSFASEGPHNRMCDPCRRSVSEGMI